MDKPNFKTFMSWMHFHEHHRNLKHLSQFLCER
jgi:hypothetical protein